MEFAVCVVAAGAESGKIAKLAKIGTGPGVLTVPLPVEPRYTFKNKIKPRKKIKY